LTSTGRMTSCLMTRLLVSASRTLDLWQWPLTLTLEGGNQIPIVVFQVCRDGGDLSHHIAQVLVGGIPGRSTVSGQQNYPCPVVEGLCSPIQSNAAPPIGALVCWRANTKLRPQVAEVAEHRPQPGDNQLCAATPPCANAEYVYTSRFCNCVAYLR
jgi:hypothetical protein